MPHEPTDSHAIVPATYSTDANVLALLVDLHSAAPGLPYEREILLLKCDVKGTSCLENTDDLEADLEAGTRLLCAREPGNREDAMAVRLETQQGRVVGYLPRANNEVIARLLDAGKLVFARVQTMSRIGSWLRVSIDVLFQDL